MSFLDVRSGRATASASGARGSGLAARSGSGSWGTGERSVVRPQNSVSIENGCTSICTAVPICRVSIQLDSNVRIELTVTAVYNS